MPLLKGKGNIGHNISELEQRGTRKRSKSQILAIALHVAGESKKSGEGLKKLGRRKK